MSDYLTTAEALSFLKIARSTLYRWVEQRRLKAYKLAGGKKVYFRRDELEKLFQPVETAPEPEAESELAKIAEPGEIAAVLKASRQAGKEPEYAMSQIEQMVATQIAEYFKKEQART